MLWSIDTCQYKVSADQYHVTISRAQVYSSSRSRVLLKSTANQVQFSMDAGSFQVVGNRAGLFKVRLSSARISEEVDFSSVNLI